MIDSALEAAAAPQFDRDAIEADGHRLLAERLAG
jgi:hypothetical protein